MTWQLLETLPDGHRLFVTDQDAPMEVAIADDSGETPPETDDGVLLLDFGRFLTYYAPQGEKSHCSIPLRAARQYGGSLTRTPTNPATLLRLSARFEWRILTQLAHTEHLYQIREVDPT